MSEFYCIWDFNGTILDDVELCIHSVNTLLARRGLPLVTSREEYRKKFDFPVKDYYRELGFDFECDPYDALAEEWMEVYNSDLCKAKLFCDVVPTIDFFESRGIRQSVLSASEVGMLHSQLMGLGIADRFEEIMGIDSIYADSKLSLAHAWRERHKDARVIFIGDTTHDFETAEALGAECFIVCTGYQCREKFEGKKVKIFDSLTDIVEYLNEVL